MHRCYIEANWIDQWQKDNTISLPAQVSHRLFKVLRIKEDELIGLFDGQGRQIEGRADGGMLKDAVLHVEASPAKELSLLQASIEEAKIIETIKRGTEFGIDRFVIFGAEHSPAFLLKKLEHRRGRLESVAIDASRQCGRFFVPSIIFAHTLKEALSKEIEPFWGVFGDPHSKQLLSTALKSLDSDLDAFIAVGPEGGFSNTEHDLLKLKGFLGLRWAPFVLRTELAALAPASLINAFWAKA